jgi:colicin import membrane protein
VAAAAAPELPQALTAAIAAEIERAASQARGEIEGRLVQAQAEAAELAAAGEALEAERDELAEQVAVLTTRARHAGRQGRPAGRRLGRGAAAHRARAAGGRVRPRGGGNGPAQDRGAGRAPDEQAAEIERLRAALAEAQQGRTAAEQQAAVLAAKLEACGP